LCGRIQNTTKKLRGGAGKRSNLGKKKASTSVQKGSKGLEANCVQGRKRRRGDSSVKKKRRNLEASEGEEHRVKGRKLEV